MVDVADDEPDGSADPLEPVIRRLGFLHDRMIAIAPDVDWIRFLADGPNRLMEVTSMRAPEGPRHNRVDVFVRIAAGGSPGAVDVDIDGEPLLSSLDVVLADRGDARELVTFASRRSHTFTPDLTRELALSARLVMTARDGAAVPTRVLGEAPAISQERLVRDLDSGAHAERLAQYSRMIARALVGPLGLAPDYVDAVCLYAPLHDIGQIDIPDRIMQKPGRLDAAQWDVMKSHPLRGGRMVEEMLEGAGGTDVAQPEVLRAIVELHHEALDGSGYPHGLSDESIPLEVRIVTVADVFDALTHSRPYKPGWPVAQALEEMDRMAAAGALDGRCLTALATQLDALQVFLAVGQGVEGRQP